MAISVGTPTTATPTFSWDGSKFVATISHTTTTGQNVLAVMLAGDFHVPTSIKFNGTNLTQRASQSDGNNGHVHFWDLDSPSIGAFNVEIASPADYPYSVTVVALSGVDVGGTPRGTAVTSNGFSTTASATATTAANDLVLGVASTANTAAVSSTTSVTDDLLASSEYQQVGYNTASGSSTSVTWTQSSGFWAVAAQPYKPSSAPAGLSITSVTPSSFDDGRTGIVIAGSGFGASQGSSTLTIGGQAQTVTAWSDTSITFTSVRGSNSMGAQSLTVTIK